MRSKPLLVAALALVGSFAAGAAQASHVSWSIGINAPIGPGIGIGTVISGGGGRWHPAPVYAAPIAYAPPVVYGAPAYAPPYYSPSYAPAYYAPPVVVPRYYAPPVVYAPPPVYVPRRFAYGPGYAPGYGPGRGHGWRPVAVPPPPGWRHGR